MKVCRKEPLICRKPRTARKACDSVGCSSLSALRISPKASGWTSSKARSASIAAEAWRGLGVGWEMGSRLA